MEPTYYNKRKCQNCNSPISDQTHALRKSCPRIKLEDGTVLSCKDDFHSKRNRKDNQAYRNLIKHHKMMDKKITSLLRNKGENVTLEDINRYGIILNVPLQISKNEHGEFTYMFMHHSIILIKQNEFKIKNHEPLF